MDEVIVRKGEASVGSAAADAIDGPRLLQRPLNVLVVDDDELLAEFLAMKIEALGCSVKFVGTAEAAVARLLEHPFDVLVTDWNLPGIDGMELVRRLRASARDAYLYIIMVTARGNEEGVRAGLKAGVDDFIRKPVDEIELELGIASARRIVDLQRRLARRTRHIAAAHRRTREAFRQVKRDLEAAAATQRQLLPPERSVGSLRTAGVFLPSAEIGGDIYNVVPISGGLTFFHLDVEGHGVPAALRSFALHNQLSNITSPQQPREVAAALNAQVLERDLAYFTMIYGIADAEGRCTLVRAGHPYALHHQRKSGIVSPLKQGGLPIGLFPSEDYPETSVILEPGDRLYLYSDGVVDCADDHDVPYGEERLTQTISRMGAAPLSDVLETIAGELRQHRGRALFEDDISLLTIERAAA